MQCPFLHKLNVKYCGLYRRTMIPINATSLTPERCTGPEYRDCSLLKDRLDDLPAGDSCPYLSVADVHYCGAAPVRKLIPCNRIAVSRCTDDGHTYCPVFQAVADPRPEDTGTEATTALPSAEDGTRPDASEMIYMPEHLTYAPNHMWLDGGAGRTCHVGVDVFFTRALGRIDGVSFPHFRNECRPRVRFSVCGVDFDLSFPGRIRCTQVNAHLAVDPAEVLRDPYGRGWLFEGTMLPETAVEENSGSGQDLLHGEQAHLWMSRECDRLCGYARTEAPEHAQGVRPIALDKDTVRELHTEFFSLQTRRVSP